MSKKDRIEINSPNPPQLNTAFAGLNLTGLPPGPEETPETKAAKVPKLGRVVLRKETAHRGGKCVIVVYDFAPFISTDKIEELGRKLRNACGCGGTIKDRTIEVQGDQAPRIRSLLEKEGFRVAGV